MTVTVGTETEDELDVRRIRIRNAASAVARSATPSLLRSIHSRAVRWPTPDVVGDVEALLVVAVEEAWDQQVILTWWLAHAPALIGTLAFLVQDLGEVEASFLLHVALQARVLAGAEPVVDQVLRGAERAATWRAGRGSILLADTSGTR